MAKVVSAAELRGLSRERPQHQGHRTQGGAVHLRFQAATGQLESHGRLRAVRKDIARIYTVLQERELGIIEDPDAEDAAGGSTPAAGSKVKA